MYPGPQLYVLLFVICSMLIAMSGDRVGNEGFGTTSIVARALTRETD